jgi:hypothetical protein
MSEKKWTTATVLALFLAWGLLPTSAVAASTLNAPPNYLAVNTGLVGYWNFDAINTSWSTGTTLDKSGNNRTGSLVLMSTTTSPVVGKIGQGLTFKGSTTQLVQAAGFTELGTVNQPYTMSAWVKPTVVSANGDVIHISGSSDGGGWCLPMLEMVAGKATAISWTGTQSTATGATTLIPNRWYHLVHTWDATNGLRIYVNGALDGSAAQATFTASGGSDYVSIGAPGSNGAACAGATGSGFAGGIDDVRIYNRALSASEVRILYGTGQANLSAGASRASLAGEWLLNEGGGTIANDTSGNNRDGTITAGSWVPGRHGQALSFDGASSVVQTLGFPSQSVGKGICAWVNPATSQSGLKGLVIQEGGFYLRLNNMALEARVYNSAGATSNTYSTSATLPVGKWSHVCETVDASSGGAITLNFYINGVSALSQATDVNGPNTGGVGTNYMKIGNDDDAAGRFFQGTIDDVVVYNRLLSASEIVTIYNEHATQVNSSQNSKLTGSLVGLWSFDGPDITTSFLDKSGNGFNGYLVGTNNATSSRKTIGREGQAFSFGGLNTGGINLGSSSTLDPNRFTIATWVYTPVASSYIYNYIFSNARDCCGTYNGIELLVGYNGAGVVTGTIWNSTAFVINSSAAAVPNNTWTHVVFTYDGSNMKLYINGVLNNSVAQTTDPGTPASFNTYIGSMGAASGVTYTFNGKLDDMRLYNRALSAAEIKQLYRMGK